MSIGLIRGLQERAARAVPAPVVEHVDGWWLRYTDGTAWWAGSVLPHRYAPDLPARILAVERFYAGYGGPARFQICPGAGPDGLDTALAGRGYRFDCPMSLQTAPVAGIPPGAAEVTTAPTRDWFAVWAAVHGGGEPDRAMLHRVTRRSGYAVVRTDEGAVAVGRAVAEEGWAGVFGMATLPSARGRGAARRVLGALAGWAAGQGATHLYLQVERDNPPARRLYERAGFTELTPYHYRVSR